MFKYLISFLFLFFSQAAMSDSLTTTLQIGSSKTIELSPEFLSKYPTYAVRMDTPWFAKNSLFEGYHFKDILKSLNISEDRTLSVVAYNDYSVDIPVKDVYQYDMILANRHNGVKMTLKNKGPFILMYLFNERKELATAAYYSKCPWQIKKIMIK